MKGIVGVNDKGCGEIQFRGEVLAVVLRGYAHGGVWGTILSYIDNRLMEVIKHSLEINELIYWYWWISQLLGINNSLANITGG